MAAFLRYIAIFLDKTAFLQYPIFIVVAQVTALYILSPKKHLTGAGATRRRFILYNLGK